MRYIKKHYCSFQGIVFLFISLNCTVLTALDKGESSSFQEEKNLLLYELDSIKLRTVNKLNLQSEVLRIRKNDPISVGTLTITPKFCFNCYNSHLKKDTFWALLQIDNILNQNTTLMWFNSDNVTFSNFSHEVYEIFLIK